MIVVDTNVITYLVLRGDFSAECTSLFLWDSDWAAPRLWRDELANVLATYERNSLLKREDALNAFQDADAIIAGNEFEMGIERVLSVASRTGCSAYDSQYIALAEDLGVTLFTYDNKVLSMAGKQAMKPGNQEV